MLLYWECKWNRYGVCGFVKIDKNIAVQFELSIRIFITFKDEGTISLSRGF